MVKRFNEVLFSLTSDQKGMVNPLPLLSASDILNLLSTNNIFHTFTTQAFYFLPSPC